MPFDSTPTRPDVSTLAGLAWTLRHPEAWPEGFVWDYGDCKSCAMGLAWSMGALKSPGSHFAMAVYDISEITALNIFFSVSPPGTVHVRDITPEHVADAIDAHLSQTRGA